MANFNAILRIGLLSLLAICIVVLLVPAEYSQDAAPADISNMSVETYESIEAREAVYAKAAPLDETFAKGGAFSSELDLSETENSMATVFEEEALSRPKMLLYTTYTVKQGDTISGIAQQFALEWGTLLSVNKITNAKFIRPGDVLKIPNQDGVLANGVRRKPLADLIKELAKDKKYDEVPTNEAEVKRLVASVQAVNEIFSPNFGTENTSVFIPGVKMHSNEMREITGDMFIWPLTIRGYPTDSYGNRANPFTGTGREFHNGMDIAAATGTPIRAAMSGRVSFAGWSNSYGNYVIITHSGGYRTLYAHMSKIRTTSGAYVGAGERIGDVGSTGRSTGAHLHFTVYKNGATINPRLVLSR